MDEHLAALALIMALAAWSIVADEPMEPVQEFTGVIQRGS
jgi:hypothetical protein